MTEYEAFVEKFKPKKTTDDCYTPPNIYEIVKQWAVQHYALGAAPIVRPFYPGGDFEAYKYPKGCVVLDNPPFSIITKICRFYMEKHIRFFLFAPTLTLFSTASGTCNYVPVGLTIRYENGANVSTSFVTNMGAYKIETTPDLYQQMQMENDKNTASVELPKYTYPANVITGARVYTLSQRGQVLRVKPEDAAFIRSLDAQKSMGKVIFGAGFLLSDRATAERVAAERVAAERAAAERAAEKKAIEFHLSEREKEIIASLGG